MTEERARRRWPPVLWAIIALPLWATLTLVPALLAGTITQDPDPSVWWLVPGGLVATALLLRVDRRVGPESPPALWAPPVAWWTAAAFLAGCGALILASEVGNIMLSLTQRPVDTPATALTAIEVGVLAVVNGLCLVVVLQGVVQRALALRWPRHFAIAGTVAVGAFLGGGQMAIQFALLLVLPTWLFAHTRALLPSMAAMVPQALPPLLAAAGLSLGVTGFDEVGTQGQWQPVWFNVLGGVLVAAGVAPLLQAFGPPEPPR